LYILYWHKETHLNFGTNRMAYLNVKLSSYLCCLEFKACMLDVPIIVRDFVIPLSSLTMFHQKCSKIAISNTSTKFYEKKHFCTLVIAGSSCMLVWKDVEIISEFSTTWIARYELSNSQKFFHWSYRKFGSCTLQGHICMKKCPKW